MTMNAEHLRQKAKAQTEAQRHARYAAVDAMRENTEPATSSAIKAAGKRVEAATAKEDKDLGPIDPSPNASIRSFNFKGYFA